MKKLFSIMTVACAVSVFSSQAFAVCVSGRMGQGSQSYQRGEYEQSEYDQRGYDQRGYDQRGYDQTGYDRRDSDQRGYDRRGYSHEGSSSRYASPRDEEIMLNIRYALSDPALTSNGDRIQISVNNGMVHLRGEVNEEEEKQDIAEAVKTIRGVKDVQMDLRISDFRSGQRQQQSYRYDPYLSDDLAYEELDQEMVYEDSDRSFGTQPDKRAMDRNQQGRRTMEQDRRSAERRMSMDQERSDAQKGQDNLSDSEIKEKIVDKLTNTWIRKKYEGIQVDVRNQQVTLRGTVDSQSDLNEIENRIHQIPQVKSINNEIKIKQINSQSQQNPQNPQRP